MKKSYDFFRVGKMVTPGAAAVVAIFLLQVAPEVRGTTLTTLYSFPGGDGQEPQGELVADDAGNLYVWPLLLCRCF